MLTEWTGSMVDRFLKGSPAYGDLETSDCGTTRRDGVGVVERALYGRGSGGTVRGEPDDVVRVGETVSGEGTRGAGGPGADREELSAQDERGDRGKDHRCAEALRVGTEEDACGADANGVEDAVAAALDDGGYSGGVRIDQSSKLMEEV